VLLPGLRDKNAYVKLLPLMAHKNCIWFIVKFTGKTTGNICIAVEDIVLDAKEPGGYG